MSFIADILLTRHLMLLTCLDVLIPSLLKFFSICFLGCTIEVVL